jgi:3-hydroxyethyl bacteriochlorophyllide a dehydrogenase
VVPAAKAIPIAESLGEQGVLLSLAATAVHALAGHAPPDLVVGHGVLGRLLARAAIAMGHPAPVVWETNPTRRAGASGYTVIDPAEDARRDYRSIYDVSGDPGLLDSLISRLARGGEVVLAGFYAAPLSFSFPPAFMREARLRIAAEFTADDMAATQRLLLAGLLPLDGLLTHSRPAVEAPEAYRTAFTDPACLKMVLNWSACA